MVLTCCIKNCKTRYVVGGPITMHRFPISPTRQKAWIDRIGDENLKSITKNARICSRHFKDDCFDTNKFGGTWLKSDALPTEFECFIKNRGKNSVQTTLSSMENSLKSVTSAGVSTSTHMEPSQSNSKGSNHLGQRPIIIKSPIIFIVQSNYKADGSLKSTPMAVENETNQSNSTSGPSNSLAMMTENDSSLSNCDDGTQRGVKQFGEEEDMISLAMAKKALAVAKNKISAYKKEMKNLHKCNTRLRRKVEKLEEITSYLNSNHCISDSAASVSKAT